MLFPDTNYSFLITVKDQSGNTNTNSYSHNVKTSKSNNTSCSGQLSTSQQGSFDVGFKYSFTTSGSSVTMEFELLDNKSDLIAYAWKESPFDETQMSKVSDNRFSLTLNNQTIGQ